MEDLCVNTKYNYNHKDISFEAIAYLEKNLATWYKHWKHELHAHFKRWDDPKIDRLEGFPTELLEWPKDWKWLCKHFMNIKFVKKFVATKKARESKTLIHHSGLMSFSYRVEA